MNCTRCGNEIQPGAQWCTRCGQSFAAGPGAPQPVPPGGPPAGAPPAYAAAAPAPAPYGAAPPASPYAAAAPAPAAYAPAPAASPYAAAAPAPAPSAAPPAPQRPVPLPPGTGVPAAAPAAPEPARPFDPDERWLACEQCGNPLQVPVGGGPVPCAQCGATLTAPPRPDTRVPPSPPMDERARLELLRRQDGRPLLAPPGLEGVVTNGKIEQWKIPEARLVWGQTRRHLLANPYDSGAGERLSFLTVALSNELTDLPNPNLPLRALYEGALEAITIPRHRQVMRGMLARRAAKYGDLAAAQGWLAGCDPNSQELMTDSAYRVSLAYLATMANDPATVVRMVGRTAAEVPTEDSMDAMTAILRANAVEKLGDVAGATALLLEFASSRGGGMGVVEMFVKLFPAQLQVCAQSIAAAQGAHRQQVVAGAGGTGWIGWIILGAGLTPAFIVVPLVITGEAPIFALIFAVVFPLAFGGWGLKMIKAARRSKLIAQTGQRCTARILAVNMTGTTINNVPLMRIELQVMAPGRPPVPASTTKLLQPQHAAGLAGREVSVIWSPAYPDEAVLEDA
jgi:hypothetical protein